MARKIAFKKEEIESAVKRLEAETGGELVVHVAAQSSEYREVKWILAGLCSFACALCIAILAGLWMSPSYLDTLTTSVVILAAGLLGWVIGHFTPALSRIIAGRRSLETRTLQRAETVFLEEEIFNTQERIGILLFISILERKVILLADSGINAKIQDNMWGEIVDKLAYQIKKNRTEEGLVQSIEGCRQLLLEHGFKGGPGDKNELSDSVRMDI